MTRTPTPHADIREEFARIAESRRKPPISGSNIGYNCAIDEIVADLRALPSCGGEVPEGWQLVPKEPTDDMIEAGVKDHAHEQSFDGARETYVAMLAASPPPPVSAEETTSENGYYTCGCFKCGKQYIGVKGSGICPKCKIAPSIRNAIAAMELFARAAKSFAGDPDDAIFKISTLKVRHLRQVADALAALKRESGTP